MKIKGLLFSAILALAAFAAVQPRAGAFETGGDMSEMTYEQSANGMVYQDSTGKTIDPIAYAKANGWTCCRLRLLVDGGTGVLCQTESYDLALATKIKAQGMKLILDIFYSNGWCDPSQQTTPKEWQRYKYSQLASTVQSYTANVITDFKNNGTLPDYVQIGNEISNGMLWPVGSLSNQSQFIGLIQAGIAGVRQVSSTPKIILHCNNAADTSLVEWFYNTIASQCNYDIVGLSYYPSNGTNLSDIKAAMTTYIGLFGNRPIMLVEFGYPYDASSPYLGTAGYDNTPAGQQQIVTDLITVMKGYTQGAGVIYWGATYASDSYGWECLFNTNNGWPNVQAEPAFGAL
jgi:arabinogalactan endo-1,4-beta-galactosidase